MEDEAEYRAFVRGRLREIEDRAAAAAAKGGRGQDVRIVAVTKYVGVEELRALAGEGILDFGENRWQSAREKVAALPELRWHFIGPLQRNKAGRAAEHFSLIHSVDREELARDLSSHGTRLGRTVRVLVQVNVSRELQKSGVSPEGLRRLLESCARLPRLSVEGLMAIGRQGSDPVSARRDFAALRELRDKAAADLGIPLRELSMGMSDDFEAAVEEGATLIRIGRFLVLREKSSNLA